MSAQLVSKEQFREALESKLGEFYPRAERVFDNFGPKLSFDVANVLLHAADQNKVEEVLALLEKHFEEHLYFQHPEIRGTVAGDFGVNKTKVMFLDICERVLELQLNR